VGDGARALLLARQAVPESARDYRDLLWLAHVLEAAGEPYQAAQVLRTAAVRNPGLPEVWAALVGVLTRSGRPEEAQPTAEEAERKLPPERLALGLARCAEALGNLDQAEEHYQNSLEKDPGDGVLLRAAIEFFRRTDQPRKAEVLLRRLLDPRTQAPPDYAARARRQLAMVLASSGKDPDYREALALLGGRGATGENERARAMVLASRPQQRPLALRLFEESLKGQPISEDDQFLRAQLCEAAGAHQQARLLLLDLLATNPENPQYLAFHIRGLVRQGDLTAVRFFLDKLERIEPRSARMSELRTLIAYREQDGLRK
jgi:tetratricopeptide (TPR) repeat protein